MSDESRSEQGFPIGFITRAEIAEFLNGRLELEESPDSFTPDDERLTEAICEKYAAGVGDYLMRLTTEDLDDSHLFDWLSEQEQALNDETLRDMGIEFPDN